MIKKLLAAVLGIFLGLVLCEIILACLGIPKFYNFKKVSNRGHVARFFKNPADSVMYYLYIPNSTISIKYVGNPRHYFDTSNAISIHINSAGFRGSDFSFEKKGNTFRIAFIGDSFTLGEGVNDQDTYPEKTKQELKKKYPELDIESYNFGIGGYCTAQELYLLENLVLPYKPDAVVLGYNLNDVEPPNFVYDKKKDTLIRKNANMLFHENAADEIPPDELLYHFHLPRLIWKIRNKKHVTDMTIQYYLSFYGNTVEEWVNTKNSLEAFIETCRQNKIDCYVVLYPMLYRLDDHYPFAYLHSKIKKVVESKAGSGLIFIDLLPVFEGKKDADLWVHPTDHHPNEIAHEMVAEYLSRYIRVRK